METIARIRREHFIKGKTIKEIARDLKVSRNLRRPDRLAGRMHWQQSLCRYGNRSGAAADPIR
ncbi:hypothetical protein P0R31_18815 [Bradyrhizobium yuanmingense]|uniref:hypothetical protein n=1 Tax=Bradyrhizobium yuanmingense TaxID=108015 RepID=UPI0023B8D074|nr:hypothetical protein [Bradyrhizobium yuanmingense]MDF0519293.1 hypothetical protein [Bradyrhizobium yuanmingense]